MAFVKRLTGIVSGCHYPPEKLMNLDPVDGRPVRMDLDLEALNQTYPDRSWWQPERKNLWRYGALLPLDIADPHDAASIVTLGEGYTPLLPYPGEATAKAAGFRLWVKDEGRPHAGFGHNPTGSFKDRGMAVVASMARKFGLEKLAVPTQGNAGDSLARYARAAGMSVVVAMPDDTPMPILGGVAAAAMRDPKVKLELVSGTIREAGLLLKERYLPEGWFNCATFQEPGWRIEGKKTLGLEIAEALADDSGRWQLPDVIVYPTGGGTGVLGMWKAFDELEALGQIGPQRPRMICVQSRATAPLVKAFETGAEDTQAEDPGNTLAVGLNVPGGVGHIEVLRIIRASGGRAIAVDESDIARTFSETWQQTHWWICPEGAACLAALPALFENRDIGPVDRVVVVNTGSFEKYLPDVSELL
jgi:threonine synthase